MGRTLRLERNQISNLMTSRIDPEPTPSKSGKAFLRSELARLSILNDGTFPIERMAAATELRPVVSKVPSKDRTLSIRTRPGPPAGRAKTVISTQSRRHRQGSSHHGRSSSNSNNEFPCFDSSGDVEILIESGGRTQRYLLHRLILAQCSGFFEASTSEEWSKPSGYQETIDPSIGPPALTASGEDSSASIVDGNASDFGSRVGGRSFASRPPLAHGSVRWRYVLDWADCKDGELPMLVQKAAPTSLFGGRAGPNSSITQSDNLPARRSGLFRGMMNSSVLHIASSQQSNHSRTDNTISDYDNLFRVFYNYVPNLSPTDIATAYLQAKSLLALADMYDALAVVGPRVDHHLLQFRGQLWAQIAKYPPSYLKLGYMARSKVIFAEALVHVVGQWPQGANHLRIQMPAQVFDVIEDKVDEMDELKRRIEARLFRLSVASNREARVKPETNHLDWSAVSLFRHWFIENTMPQELGPPPASERGGPQLGLLQLRHPGQTRTSVDLASTNSPSANSVGASRAYRLIAAGGSAYLAHPECKRFLKSYPGDCTRENLRRFEAKIEEIKSLAGDIVRPLMRSYLEGDGPQSGSSGPISGGVSYLTCTKVGDRDFPWER